MSFTQNKIFFGKILFWEGYFKITTQEFNTMYVYSIVIDVGLEPSSTLTFKLISTKDELIIDPGPYAFFN